MRTIVFIDGDLVVEEKCVFCPWRASTTGALECMRCADLARIDSREVVCERQPQLSDAEALELVEARRIVSGEASLAARTPVGTIVENVVVCATAATSIDVVLDVAARMGSHGIVVVDVHRRPTGFSTVARLARMPMAAVLCLADCVDESLSVLDERAPLSRALEVLVHRRQRAAVVVDADGRVTGLVWDLDVLRWLARAAHGHMSHE
jgi:CBS-domain-containing membrane protein